MSSLSKELRKLNALFMKKYPYMQKYSWNHERKDVKNIPNSFLFDWFRYNEYYNSTPERVVKSLKDRKKLYKTSFMEYVSDSSKVMIEIKSRRCKKGDKYSRKNYVWDEWIQYGYVVWRETRNGFYEKEFETHYEHKLCAYLLECNLKKYFD